MAIIEARGLARTFRSRKRTVEAVRGVDLTVGDGEIVGFLGPNGAGKTTTLRMLTTLLNPTGGTATVAGADLLRDPVGLRRRIGYVPQAIGQTAGGTDPAALVIEELADQGALYRLPPDVAARRARTLIGQFELSGLEQRPVKTLSGGQRRRLEVALGLVHQPPLVFLTTHYLEEADVLCDRVLIIDHGVIAAEGTPDELKRRAGRDRPGRLVVRDRPAGQERGMREAYAGRYFDAIMVEGIAVAAGMAAAFLWFGSRVFLGENA